MPKKVLVALPPGLLEQIDFVAQVEHRTRSDLIREALRRYIDGFRRSQGPRMTVSAVGSQKVALLTDSE
jgi:metal-responsive CopG/Arc/MetJ family transcriptional regulator